MRRLKLISVALAILSLFALFLFLNRRTAQQPLYAAIGMEAVNILQKLIDPKYVMSIQTGTMLKVLEQQNFAALVVPENRQDDIDVVAARKAGIRIVTILRHTDLASITTNVAMLGKLTGQEQAANQWIAALNADIARIKDDVADKSLVRVLVLSPEGYTQGNGALITELLSTVKGINVAAEAGIPEAREINDGQIRDFAPDVVLLLNWSPALAYNFISSPLYKGIPAFDNQRIYATDSPGKNVAQLTSDLRLLADLIHVREF